MERMKDLEKELEKSVGEIIIDLQREIRDLEEENKKLKEYNGELIENHKKDITILCEENKKLREELSAYDREFRDEDKKAKNIYKSQKENILMGKI